MAEKIDITFKRASTIFSNKYLALAYLNGTTFKRGEPAIVVYTDTSDKKGDDSISALFAIGVDNGVGKYHLCSSYQDFVNVTTALDIHIGNYNEFKQLFDDLFEYDSTNKRIKARKPLYVEGDIISDGEVVAIAGDAAPAGVTDYAQLTGKPKINGIELASGNNTLAALGIQPRGDYATKSALDTINALIPSTATSSNQLADKAFVNSSISTATAEFRGTFTSLDELKATSGNLNDYAFYLHKDSVGNSIVDRYKWTTAGWLYEYTLNNSSFTAEQWAALNSAITATLVQSYNSHLKDTTIHITAAERNAWNNKWDYNEETIKGVKVNAAVLSDKATKLATARKIWGRYFDGLADVSGDLTEVGNITASGKATIQGDIVSGGEVVAVAGEAGVAGVSDYAQLTGKPMVNGVELASGNNTLAQLGIQPAGSYAAADHTHSWSVITGKPTFAAVATSGNYNDLINKPTIPTIPASLPNPYALTFGSKTYNGSVAVTLTASDIISDIDAIRGNAANGNTAFGWGNHSLAGYLTGITKAQVEAVLTGDITSHTHSFASLTSKPTTLAGYGITDAYTSTTIDSKLSGYLPLSGGIMHDDAQIKFQGSNHSGSSRWAMAAYGPTFQIQFGGYGSSSTPYVALELNNNGEMFNYGNLVINSGNIGSQSVANADTVDYLHASDFARSRGADILPTDINHLGYGYGHNGWGYYGPAFTFGISSYYARIQKDADSNRLYVSSWVNSSINTDWSAIAFLTDNVASATKLQTARTIFGRTFDGTANVTGGAKFNSICIETDDSGVDSYRGSEINCYINNLFLQYDSPTHLIVCRGGGNVGIGTTSPAYKLDVNGTGHFKGDLIVDGEVVAVAS